MYGIPPELGAALLQLGSLLPSDEADDDEGAERVIAAAIQALGITEAQSLLKSRRGQGKFRADLIYLWTGRCAVTGLSNVTLLRASHIKPWAVSNNYERLDAYNGLLLAASVDRLFDQGLISFSDNGALLIGSAVTQEDRLPGLSAVLPD